jgi:CAAX protease family protein
MDVPDVSRRSIVATAIACEGGLGLVALAFGWFLERPPLGQIAWTATAVGQGLLAATPMLLALWLMTRWPLGPLKSLGELVERLLVPMFRPCTLVDLLLISTAAGVGEELLFRGVLQAGLAQWSGSVGLAVGVAAVVFGLAHPISITYAVLAAVIGVYLGWLLVATGNLLVPIVTHAAYDFFALVYLLGRSEREPLVAVVTAETSASAEDQGGAL